MFVQGILSLLHVWLLPGFLVMFFFSRFKLFDIILFSIPLSLLINYHLVKILILLNIFNYTLINLIIIIELLLISKIFLKKELNIKKILQKKFSYNLDLIDFLNFFIFLIFLYLGVSSLGKAIPLGDGIVNFHSWAVELFNQKIPDTWGWYTLGVSTSQAIIYKAINNSNVQFFTQAFFSIYPSLSFLIFYRFASLYKENKKKYDLIRISCFIFALLIINVYRHYALHAGYVDPILCIHTIFCIYIFAYLKKQKSNDTVNLFFLFSIISLGFLIKPNGLYNSILFFIALLFFFKENILKSRVIYLFIFVHIIFIAPTFIYKFINIYFLGAEDISLNLINIYDFTILEKIKNSLPYAFGIFSIFLIFILFLNFKKDNFFFKILFIYFLPWFFIWMLFFQYDNRNLTFVFPVLAISLARGVQNFFSYINNFKKIEQSYKIFLVIFIVSFISIIQVKRSEKILVERDLISKMKRGSSETNILLYNYFLKSQNSSIVYVSTNNEFEFLPKIGKIFKYQPCSIKFYNSLKNLHIYKNIYLLIRVGDPGCTEKLLYFYKKNNQIIFRDILNRYYLFKVKK